MQKSQKIVHLFDNPRIITRIAHALIDSTQPTEKDAHLKILNDLKHFSLINKKIHKTLFHLRCSTPDELGTYNRDTINFSNHLRAHLAECFIGESLFKQYCLAVAFIATPWALYQLQNLHYFIDTTKATFMAPLTFTAPENIQEKKSFEKTLEQFPKSTRLFCKEWMEKKEQ
jgi:hypothetical protein